MRKDCQLVFNWLYTEYNTAYMKQFALSLVVAVLAALVFMAVGYTWIKFDLLALQADIATLEDAVTELQQVKPQPLQNGVQNGNSNSGPEVKQPQQSSGNDILSHAVFVTTSADPLSFADSAEPVFTKGSVPEAVLLTQSTAAGNAGDILMYFPSFEKFVSNGDEQIAMARSTDDGATWSERELITLENGSADLVPVDPSLVQLDDGRLRMYFFDFSVNAGGQINQPTDHIIYSAVSEDGLNFTMEDGERYIALNITDPEVIYHDNQWIMYLSEGPITHITTAKDGLTFIDTGLTWQYGGVPGAYVDAENVVHLYGCGQGGIMTQTSTTGIDFSKSAAPVAALTTDGIICDPSPVGLDDGTVVMVYKKVI